MYLGLDVANSDWCDRLHMHRLWRVNLRFRYFSDPMSRLSAETPGSLSLSLSLTFAGKFCSIRYTVGTF